MGKTPNASEVDWKNETTENRPYGDSGGREVNRRFGGKTKFQNTRFHGCYLEAGLFGDNCRIDASIICSGVKFGNKVYIRKLSEVFLPITIGERCALDNVILQTSGNEYRASISWQEDKYRIDKDIPIEIKRINERINSKAISPGRRWKIDGVSEGYISNKMAL